MGGTSRACHQDARSLRPHLEEASRNSQSGYIVERNGKRVREITALQEGRCVCGLMT